MGYTVTFGGPRSVSVKAYAEKDLAPDEVRLTTAVRVQDLQRYYALVCDGEKVRLIKNHYGETILAETTAGWELGRPYELVLEVTGFQLVGYINGEKLVEATDPSQVLNFGGIGLIVEEGRIGCEDLSIESIRE